MLCHWPLRVSGSHGGGLFGAAINIIQIFTPSGMQGADQICTIIHCQMGFVVNSCIDMFVINLVTLAFDSESGDFVSRNQCGCYIILVESGLEAVSTISAPPACNVVIKLAVSVVTCRQAETRIPFRGCSF